MTFVIDRTELDARFRDVRALLSFIKLHESSAVPPADSEEVKIMRGLFYVHLYGAVERSVNEIFQAYLRALASLEIVSSHTTTRLWPSAFDSKFKAMQSTLGPGNWRKRGEFLDATESLEVCKFNDALFSDQLQNVWPETVDTVLSYLGLSARPWSDAERFSLTEVVDKRNQVAHGRTEPARVGAGGRSNVLESRFGTLLSFVNGLADFLEYQFHSLSFVRAERQAEYAARVASGHGD